jgi:hypothetical protein
MREIFWGWGHAALVLMGSRVEATYRILLGLDGELFFE